MRSWDGFQKGAGDMIVVSMIADIVRGQLGEKLGIAIAPGRLDGLVTDVHIYENTYEKAQQVVFDYLHEQAPQVATSHDLVQII
jgi:hypothetical protein